MPVKKGSRKPEYSDKQKAEIVEYICSLYESQNATLESCCEAAGISYTSFYLWTSRFEDFKDRFKKAKAVQDENYWQTVIMPKAKTAIERLLEGEETIEEKTEDLAHNGKLTGDTKTTIIKKSATPNPTAAIFAIKGLFPERFVDRHEHSGPNGGPIEAKTWIIEIPPPTESTQPDPDKTNIA